MQVWHRDKVPFVGPCDIAAVSTTDSRLYAFLTFDLELLNIHDRGKKPTNIEGHIVPPSLLESQQGGLLKIPHLPALQDFHHL